MGADPQRNLGALWQKSKTQTQMDDLKIARQDNAMKLILMFPKYGQFI
jgi:hypothetical protein